MAIALMSDSVCIVLCSEALTIGDGILLQCSYHFIFENCLQRCIPHNLNKNRSEVEERNEKFLRTRQTNQLNQIKKQF